MNILQRSAVNDFSNAWKAKSATSIEALEGGHTFSRMLFESPNAEHFINPWRAFIQFLFPLKVLISPDRPELKISHWLMTDLCSIPSDQAFLLVLQSIKYQIVHAAIIYRAEPLPASSS